MTDAKPNRFSRPKRAAIAAAIVAVAIGAGAVYVSGTGSGNDGGASEGTDIASNGNCAAAVADAKALAPFATGSVAAMSPADTPRSLSAVSFTDADGKAATLSDYSGKTLLVNLWATWCVPCRTEMPALDALEEKKGGDAFQVVAINIDTGGKDKPARFLKDTGVTHVALHRDPTMDVFNTLKKEGLAFGLPVTLLVGEDGCLLAAMNGPAEWDDADAAKLVDAAIGLSPDKQVNVPARLSGRGFL